MPILNDGCPRCETACLEDEENNAQCSKCFFSFCSLCRERRHIGDRCLTPEEKLLSLQDREKARASSSGKVDKRMDLDREKARTSSSGKVDKSIDLVSEFVNELASLSHQCELEEEQESVRQADIVMQIEMEIEVTAQRFRNYRCPSCGQQNPKVGNNHHMFCWACQVHYCTLCRKVVRKSSEHYGPRGCKQHTVDPEIPQQKKDDEEEG